MKFGAQKPEERRRRRPRNPRARNQRGAEGGRGRADSPGEAGGGAGGGATEKLGRYFWRCIVVIFFLGGKNEWGKFLSSKFRNFSGNFGLGIRFYQFGVTNWRFGCNNLPRMTPHDSAWRNFRASTRNLPESWLSSKWVYPPKV